MANVLRHCPQGFGLPQFSCASMNLSAHCLNVIPRIDLSPARCTLFAVTRKRVNSLGERFRACAASSRASFREMAFADPRPR